MIFSNTAKKSGHSLITSKRSKLSGFWAMGKPMGWKEIVDSRAFWKAIFFIKSQKKHRQPFTSAERPEIELLSDKKVYIKLMLLSFILW